MSLEFRKFEKSNFEEYEAWFRNEKIKRALAYIDEEWLAYILNDTTGIEYCVFNKEEELVAVVGLKIPSEEHLFYVLTNIAIKPSYFQMGIGSRVLNELLKLHPSTELHHWVAFVAIKNTGAQLFFEKNGWLRGPQEEDMIRYEKRN